MAYMKNRITFSISDLSKRNEKEKLRILKSFKKTGKLLFMPSGIKGEFNIIKVLT